MRPRRRPVESETIKKIRAAVADRQDAWTQVELLKFGEWTGSPFPWSGRPNSQETPSNHTRWVETKAGVQ